MQYLVCPNCKASHGVPDEATSWRCSNCQELHQIGGASEPGPTATDARTSVESKTPGKRRNTLLLTAVLVGIAVIAVAGVAILTKGGGDSKAPEVLASSDAPACLDIEAYTSGVDMYSTLFTSRANYLDDALQAVDILRSVAQDVAASSQASASFSSAADLYDSYWNSAQASQNKDKYAIDAGSVGSQRVAARKDYEDAAAAVSDGMDAVASSEIPPC